MPRSVVKTVLYSNVATYISQTHVPASDDDHGAIALDARAYHARDRFVERFDRRLRFHTDHCIVLQNQTVREPLPHLAEVRR